MRLGFHAILLTRETQARAWQTQALQVQLRRLFRYILTSKNNKSRLILVRCQIYTDT